MASARKLSEALKFDVDRLPLPGDAKASDDALAVLEDLPERAVVERVRTYARGDADRLRPNDFLRTLQHADGALAVVTWTNAGITAIGYDPAAQRFEVGGYSAVRDMMGDDAEYHEHCTKAKAKDLLVDTRPDVVTRSEADLLGGERA